jgi:hypothetical protein
VNYLDVIAHEIRAAVPPASLPDDDTRGLFRLYALLLLGKGESVSAADVHDAWAVWMCGRDPSHESLRPFEELGDDVAKQDAPYVEAIKKVARQRGLGLDGDLFPHGVPSEEKELERTFELYKIMVASSEALVGRRQGVNTFFLTINGALLTAAGLVLGNGEDTRVQAAGLAVLFLTGAILALAWNSLLLSFGQLNTGKFAVINRIERIFPAAIFDAEWKALREGKNPKVYRTFSSREVWTPRTFTAVYVVALVVAIVALIKG